jgi:hypothetical protein
MKKNEPQETRDKNTAGQGFLSASLNPAQDCAAGLNAAPENVLQCGLQNQSFSGPSLFPRVRSAP